MSTHKRRFVIRLFDTSQLDGNHTSLLQSQLGLSSILGGSVCAMAGFSSRIARHQLSTTMR
eukprot:1298032-Rhodomonas_salina.1